MTERRVVREEPDAPPSRPGVVLHVSSAEMSGQRIRADWVGADRPPDRVELTVPQVGQRDLTPIDRIAGIATLHGLEWLTTVQYARCVCRNGEHRDSSRSTRWSSRDYVNAGGTRGTHLISRTVVSISTPPVEATS